jgi:DNA invertase Pin-like site-specific DNA recombinase
MEPIDIYARVSRLRDKDQTTTPAQIASCRAVLAERGLAVGEVWVDDGKSAWNPAVYRDGWERLMARLESGESGGVVVYDLERFARQLKDGERLVTAAERGLIVLDSEGEYDLRKPGDKRNFRNAIVAAEYYSDLLRAKTRRGKAAKAHAGQVDQRRSFGFESDGITIVESEAAIIRDHAARLLAGETQESLIRELNEMNVPSVRGAKWGYTTYRQIMTRPRNVGLIQHNGRIVDGVRLPGEPILERLAYDRIVALYAARKPGRAPSGRYVLTGIAGCGECGAGLSGRPGSTGKPQYWCRKCHHTFVDAERLDEWAGDFAIRVLRDQAQSEALEREGAEREARRQELLSETAGIEQTLTELAVRLGRQEMSLARHDAACKPLEARQSDIRRELGELASAEPEPVPARTISERDAAQVGWLEVWVDGTPAERRSMVLRALSGRKIVVDRALRDGRLAVGEDGRRFDSNRVRIS